MKIVLIAMAGWLAAACASPVASTPPVAGLILFADASLGPALDTASAAYAASHAGITVIQSNGASADLRRQVEQGAAADLFLAADTVNPQALADAGLATGPPVVFARGADGAEYGAAVLRRSPDQDRARDFLEWLRGPDGQAVLAQFGFQAP